MVLGHATAVDRATSRVTACTLDNFPFLPINASEGHKCQGLQQSLEPPSFILTLFKCYHFIVSSVVEYKSRGLKITKLQSSVLQLHLEIALVTVHGFATYPRRCQPDQVRAK